MNNRNIFVYWNQGFDKCPPIIKKCVESIEYYNSNWNIIKLDDNNLSEYIDILQLIPNIKEKNITSTSMSDIIRLCLLKKHGGIWCDATVFCVKPFDEWLNEYIKNGFFVFEQKHYTMMSSWFIYADKDNYMITKWLDSAIDYIDKAQKIGIHHNAINTLKEWNNGDKFNNHYFWVHYLFTDNYKSDVIFKNHWDKVLKLSGVSPHHIQHIGFNTLITERIKNEIINTAPLYKLSYRIGYDIQKDNVINFLFNSITKI